MRFPQKFKCIACAVATPLTIWLFVLVALSGLLMFFDVHAPKLKAIHEWLGVFFVLVGLLHLWRNAAAFVNWLHKPVCWGTLLLVLIVAVLVA